MEALNLKALYEERLLRQVGTVSEFQGVKFREKPGAALGSVLWSSASVLASHLAKMQLPRNMRVLELGAGVGLSGLFCSVRLGAERVVLSDLPATQALLEENISLNRLSSSSAQARILDWTKPPPDWLKSEGFNLIIASDCVYYDAVSLFRGLVDVIYHICSASSEAVLFVLGYKRRHAGESLFFQMMADKGFKSEEVNCDNGHYVFIFRLP